MKKVILTLLLVFTFVFSNAQMPILAENDVGKICVSQYQNEIVFVIAENSLAVDAIILRDIAKQSNYKTKTVRNMYHKKDVLYSNRYIGEYQPSRTYINPTAGVNTILLNHKIISGSSGGLSY